MTTEIHNGHLSNWPQNVPEGARSRILAMLRGTHRSPTQTTQATYNGYSNYETWNAALWIGNEYSLYSIARRCDDYAEFQELMIDHYGMSCTPDGVLWNDSELNHNELDEVIKEL